MPGPQEILVILGIVVVVWLVGTAVTRFTNRNKDTSTKS